MLSSLPPFPPPDVHDLWYHRHTTKSSGATSTTPNQGHSQSSRRETSRSSTSPPKNSLRSQLCADEHAILVRKANIRRFGAAWIRPPGVSKTLQGLWDEKAEREEQEAAALREQLIANEQAAAEAAEAAEQGRADIGMLEGDESVGDDERDLDEEIPDADEDEDDDDEDEDNEDSANGTPGWVDEHGELHGEASAGDFPEGMATQFASIGPREGDMMGARDLDDDIPDAGSYQHTDTDVEDESSDEETGELFERRILPGQPPIGNAALGSSIFGSSPALEARSARGTAQHGPRRSRGGTEN